MDLADYSFGNWIKHRRKSLALTQQELAQKVGCSPSLIFKIESDERRPSLQIAELLAEHLRIPAAQRALFLKVARQEKAIEDLGAPFPFSTFETSDHASSPGRPVFAAPVKTALPIPLTSLLGRENELRAILQQIQNPACRLLTLTGPGGVGKTRLALEAARQLQNDFLEGVYFVSLVGTSAAEFILPAVTDSLGLSVSMATNPKGQLFNFLREKQLLLVLDNLEHLLDGMELLTELLENTPHLKILATSREPLRLRAEWVFAVQGLPIPSSIDLESLESNSAAALFLQRSRQSNLDYTLASEEIPALKRICELVEGLPLGLELAATWVRTLSCHEIAEEIERNIDFLAVSARDVPERHRSIRAVFDYSWNLLSEEERCVMRRLSVFRGGCTREAAERVAGASLPLLSSLVGKSLVRRNPLGRYDLHELIRQYAREQLIHSREAEEACQRHVEFFLALVEEAEPKLRGAEQIAWLDRLEGDLDNLRAALAWSLRSAEPAAKMNREAPAAQDALRLAGKLYFFWRRRSHWAEGRDWLQRALAQSAYLPDTRERLVALNAAALLAVEQADTRSAGEYAQENLRLSQYVGESQHVATAFNTLGLVRWKQKKYAEARSLCEQGLALFRDLGDRFGVAEALHSLGHITVNQGDLQAAQSYLDENLSIARELEDKIGSIDALGDLGLVAYLRRDYVTAQSYLEDSLKRFQEAKALPGLVSALNRLGDLARCQGDYGKASRAYQEALSLYREMGDLDEIPSILHNLGYTAQHRSKPFQALALFREALSIQHKMGNRAGIAECLMGIAGVLAEQGQVEAGARLLGAAEVLREATGAVLWPANQMEYDRILSSLHTLMEEPALQAAWTAGRTLSMEQAVREACQ